MLWELVYNHNISILFSTKVIHTMIERGYREIINEFEKLVYVETHMVQLNRVRNFLKVLYVSNITEENGRKQEKDKILNL